MLQHEYKKAWHGLVSYEGSMGLTSFGDGCKLAMWTMLRGKATSLSFAIEERLLRHNSAGV